MESGLSQKRIKMKKETGGTDIVQGNRSFSKKISGQVTQRRSFLRSKSFVKTIIIVNW